MSFWGGKKVLITGHTGFKGSWLSLWLQKLGADVIGFALEPPSNPNLFSVADIQSNMVSVLGDVRDYSALEVVFDEYKPEIVFHMAAQAIVRTSYIDPVGTFSTNIMGTVNLLNVVNNSSSTHVVINITSDKCYENREWAWGYRENDSMGGRDPYSCSKGCAELITSSYRDSFLNNRDIAVASVRAGNVIGGGDWACDRLIPDIIRAISIGNPVSIRNPMAVRPWQHVLEPLNGYMMLAERMWDNPTAYSGGWNFGPSDEDIIPVENLVQKIVDTWGDNAKWYLDSIKHPHEANYLKLDCSKARSVLKWKPKLKLVQALDWVVEWYKEYLKASDMKKFTLNQIEKYEQLFTPIFTKEG